MNAAPVNVRGLCWLGEGKLTQYIYHLNEHGQLAPMTEEPFDLEDRLQELVAEHPGLLSGEQMNPGSPRRFMLVDREQGIADIVGGSHRWSLDHLLIDQDAIPTLVEAKRSANSEIRRSIVGQMLDYAAHATQTWNVADIRRIFEERAAAAGQDPGAILTELLQEGEPDGDAFWQQVEINLRAARIRLLFVADGIPDELTRVVEFLNEQMPGIEVLAVEIKQFRGDSGAMLVPRVIGRTAEAVATTTRWSGSKHLNRETLIESFPSVQVQQAAKCLFDVADKYRATYNWSAGGVSIRLRCAAWQRRGVSVAWLYAPGAQGFMQAGGFVFGSGNGSEGFFESLPPNLRDLLEGWVNQFSQDEFVTEVSQAGLKAWAITHEDAAANIEMLAGRLESVLVALQNLEPEDGPSQA